MQSSAVTTETETILIHVMHVNFIHSLQAWNFVRISAIAEMTNEINSYTPLHVVI